MIEEVQNLINQYTKWLHDKTSLREVGDNWVQVTTPHLDRHNDCLQIYVKKQNGGYVLTDDGYIINDLLDSGCKLDSQKRQELLKTTLAGFGVLKRDDSLEIHATAENFGLKKHNMIQAMLAVNDMFYLADSHIKSLFFEEVVSWLDLSDIRYTPNIILRGKSGYDHMFDFVIPKSKSAPERLLHTINTPSKNTAEAVAFKLIDIKDSRPPDAQAFVLINDQINSVPQQVLDALRNYDASPILWSQREASRARLAA